MTACTQCSGQGEMECGGGRRYTFYGNTETKSHLTKLQLQTVGRQKTRRRRRHQKACRSGWTACLQVKYAAKTEQDPCLLRISTTNAVEGNSSECGNRTKRTLSGDDEFRHSDGVRTALCDSDQLCATRNSLHAKRNTHCAARNKQHESRKREKEKRVRRGRKEGLRAAGAPLTWRAERATREAMHPRRLSALIEPKNRPADTVKKKRNP